MPPFQGLTIFDALRMQGFTLRYDITALAGLLQSVFSFLNSYGCKLYTGVVLPSRMNETIFRAKCSCILYCFCIHCLLLIAYCLFVFH